MTWNYRVVCTDTLSSTENELLQRRGFHEIQIPSEIGLIKAGVEEGKFYKSLHNRIQQHEWNELNSY